MTILITGASGFIGSHLFRGLKNKHQVYGIAKSSSHPDIIKCNLEDVTDCENEIKRKIKTPIDVIVHLAYVVANKDNLTDIQVLNQNILLSKNIAILSDTFKVKKVINFSSSSVYPNIDGLFNESSEINPSLNSDSLYGLSKFNSEMVLNTLIKNERVKVVHLRVVMVYGEGVKETRLWPVMEKELQQYNTITVFGMGKRLINQIHIDFLVKIVANFISNNFVGVYNVSEETLSLDELAKRLIKEKGNSESKIIYNEKGNTFQFKVDNSKLLSVLL